MRIEYDPEKRALTLAERGLDFEDAVHVFADDRLTTADERKWYPEKRLITFGQHRGRLLVVVWTPASVGVRRVISMRKANAREQSRIDLGRSR